MPACRICRNELQNDSYEVREMMFGTREIFRYFECSRCLCLQIEAFPADISKFYPREYYSRRKESASTGIRNYFTRLRDAFALYDRGVIGRLLYRRFPRSELRCLHLLPIRKDSKILDVGCGVGTLLCTLRDLGCVNVLGIDPLNEADIEHDNGVHIRKAELGSIDDGWDVVMFHHSFEHLQDPAGTLKKVASLLLPAGNCLIRIPTSSSFAWHHYRSHWVQLDAPRHFFLHSIQSMTILAREAGLEVYRVEFDSTAFQFWASELYRRDIPLHDVNDHGQTRRESMFSARQMSAFSRRAEYLNKIGQGDQAIFYLRKVNS